MKLFAFILPLMVAVILLLGAFRRTGLFEPFSEGAKEGLQAAVRVLPSLVAMLAAIELFTVSGAMDFLVRALMPVARTLGVPESIWPIALVRPLSGSAALAMLSDLYAAKGPDSLEGWIASALMGSSETIFYTLAVYLGAVKVKGSRYAPVAALIAGAVGLFASVMICRAVFGA